MANIFSHDAQDHSFMINNRWTSVLYSTLLLSGSSIAHSTWEKLCMIWLAEHDQGHVGLGIVGIDVEDIYWTQSEFDTQKSFLVGIAQKALEEQSWQLLPYAPEEDILQRILRQWVDLFQNAQMADISAWKQDFDWYVKPERDSLDKKCPIHHIFLNRLSQDPLEACYICHDT